MRDGAVVEDRELVGLVLAGRDAAGEGGILLLAAEETIEHGGRCPRAGEADEIVAQTRTIP